MVQSLALRSMGLSGAGAVLPDLFLGFLRRRNRMRKGRAVLGRNARLKGDPPVADAYRAASPPVAPVGEVHDTLHGVVVHDPYRYFENVKAPEVQT